LLNQRLLSNVGSTDNTAILGQRYIVTSNQQMVAIWVCIKLIW